MSRSCGPSCKTPSCPQPSCSPCSYPVGGLGSLSCCPTSSGSSLWCGNSASASGLGIAPGASVGCVSQIPSSQIQIQPPPFHIIIPGPILAASCDPVSVGGYTACGSGSSSSSSCGLPSCGCLGISGSSRPSGCQRVSVSKVCSSPC